ncbi:MAG: hypothetical protein V2I51_09645 [Anderseniella sp.]|jgi:hypothetical protein|nr:hypothetical protein [Anderseniella sp.]
MKLNDLRAMSMGLDIGGQIGQGVSNIRKEVGANKLVKDLEAELYGPMPEKQSLPVRALSAIGISGRAPEGATAPAAQGIGRQEPKPLTFDDYASIYQRYNLKAAKDPEVYARIQPVLEQVKQRALAEYMKGYQGDTSTLPGALDYGQYLGRGMAAFGEAPDPTKVVQQAASAERVNIARDSQQSQAQSRQFRDEVYAGDRADAMRSRAVRDEIYQQSVAQRGASAGGSQDIVKQQLKDVETQQAIWSLMHTNPDRAFQMAADVYGVQIKGPRPFTEKGPDGRPVASIEFEVVDPATGQSQTMNTYQLSQKLETEKLALQGQLDAEGKVKQPAPKASSTRPDPVTRVFKDLFSEGWETDMRFDDSIRDLMNLGEGYAVQLKQQGMPDHQAAAEAKAMVVMVKERYEKTKREIGKPKKDEAPPRINIADLWAEEMNHVGSVDRPKADGGRGVFDSLFEQAFGGGL